MDLEISNGICKGFATVKNERKLFRFYSDSLNVMVDNRKMLKGKRDGGSSCVFPAMVAFSMRCPTFGNTTL